MLDVELLDFTLLEFALAALSIGLSMLLMAVAAGIFVVIVLTVLAFIDNAYTEIKHRVEFNACLERLERKHKAEFEALAATLKRKKPGKGSRG